MISAIVLAHCHLPLGIYFSLLSCLLMDDRNCASSAGPDRSLLTHFCREFWFLAEVVDDLGCVLDIHREKFVAILSIGRKLGERL